MADPRTLADRVRSIAVLATGNQLNRTQTPPAVSKIGVISTDRNQASVQVPATTTGAGDTRASATTYTTKVPVVGESTPVLYSGDRLWARVKVILETAGPVAIGFDSSLGPVTSGKGILLTTNVPIELDVAKGNKLYILATGVNRVKLIVQPLPWLEQISGLLLAFGKMLGVVAP